VHKNVEIETGITVVGFSITVKTLLSHNPYKLLLSLTFYHQYN